MRSRSVSPSPYSPCTAGEVFRLIREGHASTRSDLGRLTGLSRTAVTLRIGQLLEHGLVVERPAAESTGGRPPVRLEFHVHGGVVLAAAIGASRSQLAVCDLAGDILSQTGFSFDTSCGPDAVLDALGDQLDELLAASGHTMREVRGVGVSLPGAVDTTTGRAVSPTVMPGWGGVAVRDHLAARFPVPVHVDNDVNVLALSEHRRRPEVDDIVVIKASTGIGAAIIAGGELQRGARGVAGEIGHIKVSDAGDDVCRCGDVGCLETVASGWALVRRLAAAGREVSDARGVAELARTGDPEAIRLLRDAGRRLGEVLAGAVNLLNPALIVIGGDLAYGFEPLAAGVREVIYQRSSAVATGDLQIVPSLRDEESGVRACAEMVLDRVLSAEAVDAALAAAR